ncbi:MAG: ribonuclease Z [Gaiellales bacterium]
MDLDLVFLGTSASAPTASRAPSATLIRRGGERVLVDCGEGTQRQLLRSDAGLVDVDFILLTHLHADHVLGLPGLLKTYSLRGRDTALTLYGPRGTEALIGSLRRVVGALSYPFEIVELRSSDRVPCVDGAYHPFRVEHGADAFGYALVEQERPGHFDVEQADRLGVEPRARGLLQRGEAVTLPDGTVVRPEEVLGEARRGRRLVLTGDTAACPAVVEAAQGADVLVHEATFASADRVRARETSHSTAAEAALTAAAAGVELLVLTHFSGRYPARVLLDEARAVFGSTVAARDFDLLTIPFPERGAPVHAPRGARTGREPTSGRASTLGLDL